MPELLDVLDSGVIEHIKLKPTDHTNHVEVDGNLYYDEVTKSFSFKNDIEDVPLHIGETMLLRVVNNSGSVIPKGAACRHNGVVGGFPQVELALADNFTHAAILGAATTSIGIGDQGYLTFSGAIRNMNTSALPEGAPVYLSDTEAGGYTTTPPAIATQVGGVLFSDATDGVFQINIRRNINLPNTIGFLQGQVAASISLTTASQNIVNYVTEGGLVMDTELTTGIINTMYGGTYRANFTFSGINATERSTIFWELYNETTDEVLYTYYNYFSREQGSPSELPISTSFSFPFKVVGNNALRIRARGSDNFTVDIDEMSFDIESVRIDV